MTSEILDRRAADLPKHARLIGASLWGVTHQRGLLIIFFILVFFILVFIFFVVVVLFLLGDVLGVFVGVHEILEIIDIGELDPHHPAIAIGIVVNGLGIVRQDFVSLHHLAAHRRIDIGHRFDGFDRAEGVVLDD